MLTVYLTCGCRTKVRVVPFYNAKFGCSSGMGHGYRLDWTHAEQADGKTTYNRKPEEKTR